MFCFFLFRSDKNSGCYVNMYSHRLVGGGGKVEYFFLSQRGYFDSFTEMFIE